MKLLKTKRTRFAEVVAEFGTPAVHTPWRKPRQDPAFQALLRQEKVMTILVGEKGTDFGLVGLKEEKGARYLVFPKSLKSLRDRRIIGIKWDEVKP